MKILKRWRSPYERGGSVGLLVRGETRVFKCEDEFGNFVVWVEQERDDGIQAASVVFGRDEEETADWACEEALREHHPFISIDWNVVMHEHLLEDTA